MAVKTDWKLSSSFTHFEVTRDQLFFFIPPKYPRGFLEEPDDTLPNISQREGLLIRGMTYLNKNKCFSGRILRLLTQFW